jgi:DNA-binding transcriptional MerR regulator
MAQYELTRRDTAGDRFTLESLASVCDIHPGLVDKFVAYGLVVPARIDDGVRWFDVAAVKRLRTIGRLRGDLGINLPGIAVAFDLLARIENLQRELIELRRKVYESPLPRKSGNGNWRR